MRSNEVVASPVGQHVSGILDYQQTSSRQFPFDKKWTLGLQVNVHCMLATVICKLLFIFTIIIGSALFGFFQSRAHPREVMTEVLNALQELNVGWKKIGHYNMKCRWNAGMTGHNEGRVNSSMQGNHCFGNYSSVIENEGVARLPDVLKFEVQVILFYPITSDNNESLLYKIY